MNRPAIIVALLAGLAVPSFSAQFTGPAYTQAANLAIGKTSPEAAFNGDLMPRNQVDGTWRGETSRSGAHLPSRPTISIPTVPAPREAAAKDQTTARADRLMEAGVLGAFIGGIAGWIVGVFSTAGAWELVGGLVGGGLGILAGFAIGMVLSKILR